MAGVAERRHRRQPERERGIRARGQQSELPADRRRLERMFQVLKSLPCDIFLGAHGAYFDMEAKYARIEGGGRGRPSSTRTATRSS